MTLRATLFDMDGLLIDSEILWHRAELEIFPTLGVPLDAQDARETKGVRVDEVVRHWFRRFPWEGPSVEDVTAMLLARVGDLVEEYGVLLPGATRAIGLASARGPVALASSTPLALIQRTLAHFGLQDAFNAIHSAEFEPFGKPHPGVFLTAAADLNVAPTACLVFEDSPAGVIAAKAGRMTVVAVPALEDRQNPTYGIADLVLASLADLDEGWLDEVFAA
jgi:sugar-phosphatase